MRFSLVFFLQFLLLGLCVKAQPVRSFLEAQRYGEAKLNAMKQENVARSMKYVVLTSSIPFEKQIQEPFTVYEIRSAFDLNQNTVSIPEHCVLVFNGGAVRNGCIVGNDTRYCTKSSSADCLICEVKGSMEKIGYVVKASEKGMIANNEKCSEDNYKALRSIFSKGENLFLDGKYYITFLESVVLDRVFCVFGGELIYKRNAFHFSNDGGIVVQGVSIMASEKSRKTYFCGSKELLGPITISKIEFEHCLIDCDYLVNVVYRDLNSDEVLFGVKQVKVDHCDIKQTGRVRIRNAVIPDKCCFTHNYYRRITITPIYVCCNHSVLSSPNDESAYKYVFQNLLKGCPLIIDHNIFVGTAVPLNSYYCTALIKAFNCYFTNNYIEDIINYSDGSAATAYDAYLSCANVFYEGNYVKDVMSFTKNNGNKPLCQIGKSKSNPLSYVGIPSKRIYKNNVFVVDGDRFIKIGADSESLYTDIFINFSYMNEYLWEGNSLIYRKAKIETGRSSKSYGSFTLLNNYFEVDEVLGRGLVTIPTDEKVNQIVIQNNEFKTEKNQLLPLFTQKYSEKNLKENTKKIVITDNKFKNSVPRISFFSGEEVLVRNNTGEDGEVSGIIYLSKASGPGVAVNVKHMDAEMQFNKNVINTGKLVQYFSSNTTGLYSIDMDQVPEQGASYYYEIEGNHDFCISLLIKKGDLEQQLELPFHYKDGFLSYVWEGKLHSVISGKSSSCVWYNGMGIQMETWFYPKGKNRIVTNVIPFGETYQGIQLRFAFEST